MRLVLILLLIVGVTISTRNETKYIQNTLDWFNDALERGDLNLLNRVVKAPFVTQLAERSTFIFFATNKCRARGGRIKFGDICAGYCEFPHKNYRIEMKWDAISPTGWRIFMFQPTAGRG